MEQKGKTDNGKRTQKDYSLAFKLQVVDEVEKGFLSYELTSKKTMINYFLKESILLDYLITQN